MDPKFTVQVLSFHELYRSVLNGRAHLVADQVHYAMQLSITADSVEKIEIIFSELIDFFSFDLQCVIFYNLFTVRKIVPLDQVMNVERRPSRTAVGRWLLKHRDVIVKPEANRQ